MGPGGGKAGAGPKCELIFTDRVLVTLVHLRTGLTHEALGVIHEVGSSTIGRAIGEIRPLPAARGFAVPGRPGIRLRTLDDVFAYAAAENITLRIDGTETQVRCPKAHSPGRRAFVSGKRKRNTIKTTKISDHQGRTLWSGALRPGRMHDQTAVRTEGIAERFRMLPAVKAEVDDGYRGLANEFPDQVSAPPRKPTHLAIAALVSDRAARRATRHKPSIELVLIRSTALRPVTVRAATRHAQTVAGWSCIRWGPDSLQPSGKSMASSVTLRWSDMCGGISPPGWLLWQGVCGRVARAAWMRPMWLKTEGSRWLRRCRCPLLRGGGRHRWRG
ncbi:transposase family protein [Streptomyces sp. NPDC048409]|uniref:transposase family protein n=1 Tax=Streptomyces sp. NPDC048409 TaxID=3154723 RepID=UPI003413FB9B